MHKKQSKELASCMKAIEEAVITKPAWMKYSEKSNLFKAACTSAIRAIEIRSNASTTAKIDKNVTEKNTGDAAWCTMAAVLEGHSPEFGINTCTCAAQFSETNPGQNIMQSTKYCSTKYRTPEVAGFRLLFEKEGLRFGYLEDSIQQVFIRGNYGRYISFAGRSTNSYAGSSSYIIPGKPGYINCEQGSSGSILGWTSGGSCYGESGTDPLVIPGQPGGTQEGIFPYLLDCQDKTFDRKGDMSRAGGGKKGWIDISEDPVAAYVADAYCPIIQTLPRNKS